MNTERELIQQLRDALNEYQPCDHANTEIVSAGWHDCKQCGELIRPAHYARDREDTARVVDLIAAADAYLSKQDWIRVEDALPEPGVPVIAYVPHYGGQTNSRRIRAQYAAKHSLEQHADAEGGDYDEASDTYYCEPGWYEDNEYEEIHWRVSDEVTHWQPLPPPPEGSK